MRIGAGHCERSEAIAGGNTMLKRLLRRSAPRNDPSKSSWRTKFLILLFEGDHFLTDRPFHQFGHGMEVELFHDAFAVDINRL